MPKLLYKIGKNLVWLLDDFFRMLRAHHMPGEGSKVAGITFGVATFMDRFDHCFKPLIRRLVSLFPGNEIVVTINGHYRTDEHMQYLKKAADFCRQFPDVRIIPYTEPVGLSSLWNRIIKESEGARIIILNDDVRLRSDFRKFITGSGILDSRVATINGSWSHFVISRDMTETVGYFDEGLKEIGGEDDDYIARMALIGLHTDNFNTGSLKKAALKGRHKNEVNSYGKVIAMQEGGYSTLNTEYLEKKWEISDKYFSGAAEVNGRKHKYWKLRSENQL
jgi:hypothetical protein